MRFQRVFGSLAEKGRGMGVFAAMLAEDFIYG